LSLVYYFLMLPCSLANFLGQCTDTGSGLHSVSESFCKSFTLFRWNGLKGTVNLLFIKFAYAHPSHAFRDNFPVTGEFFPQHA